MIGSRCNYHHYTPLLEQIKMSLPHTHNGTTLVTSQSHPRSKKMREKLTYLLLHNLYSLDILLTHYGVIVEDMWIGSITMGTNQSLAIYHGFCGEESWAVFWPRIIFLCRWLVLLRSSINTPINYCDGCDLWSKWWQ
jgi:hypothetical protein